MSGLWEVITLSSAILALSGWLAALLIGPSFVARRWGSPATRVRSARLWLYAPLLAPTLLVGAMTLPSALSVADHCLTEAAHHHHHLCLVHPPHATGDLLPMAVAALMAALLGGALLLTARHIIVTARLTRALLASGRESALGADVVELDQEEPIALTLGHFRPRVAISRGLIARVSDETLRVILAHERAHLVRRDTLWASADRIFASLLPGGMRRVMLDELLLAREQACDARAAEARGALGVARALTEVWRLGLSPHPAGSSMGDGPLEARVRYLLSPPKVTRASSAIPALLIAALLLCGAGPLHALMEQLLSHLIH